MLKHMLESFIFIQYLHYFYPEGITNKNVFTLLLFLNRLTQALINTGICCCYI